MKIAQGYKLREIMGRTVITAQRNVFNGIIKINRTTAHICGLVEKGLTEEEIAWDLVNTYNVDFEKALSDVKGVCADFLERGIFEA